MTLLEKMMEMFDRIPLIDTHSHLCPVEAEYNASGDILTDWVPAYFLDDLRSAGLTEKHAEMIILAYGDDLHSVDLVTGHTMTARDNICRVLAEKVKERLFTLEQAERILQLILRENAKKLYRI